ncbi:hypothetical protein [Deinococcus koreensis]|uniref:hypothetical protein n=1 Tax=Deinococcus koreensis TaxID=2054903 RepID=UPI0013FD9D76|nr:hypothetical protein [Deinococcus koreensis]
MADLLILAALIGVPAALLWQFVKLRPTLERKEQSVDPLTGALYSGAQAHAREGLRQ